MKRGYTSALIWALSFAGCAYGGVPVDSGVVITPMDSGHTDAAVPPGDAGPDAARADAGTDAGSPDAGPSAACAAALAAATFTFESGAQGWTHTRMDGVSGSWPFDPWQNGTPSWGPPGCAEGSSCIGTDLDDNYAQCARAEIRSPSIDLRACAGNTVVLVWEQWYELWSGEYALETWYDGGLVELSRDGGGSWLPAPSSIYPGTIRINPDRGFDYECLSPNSFYVHERPGFVGASAGWETVEASFGTVPVDATVQIRFAWASGVSSETTDPDTSRLYTAPGWYIDDVRFELR